MGGAVTEDRLLTTAEVAKRLDVKPETVYAYVSRGLLTNVRAGDRRGSRFAQGEVERLAGRAREGRRPSGALERIRTGLTLLTEDELYYRGHPVSELARTASAESVAHLLWLGSPGPDEPFHAPVELVRAAAGAVAALPGTARLTDRVRVAVAAAAAADPLRHDLDPAAVVRRAEGLMATAVDALNGPEPGDGPLAARLWPALAGRPGDPAQVRLLTALLVLLADHDLAASTLAARVAASALANPYAVVSAGLGAVDGRRHGAASTLAHRFLADALDDPVAALADRLRSGDPVPGFGHRIYRTRDPRAGLVLDLLGDVPVRAAVDAVTERLAGRPGGFPNVDLALAAVVHAHGLPAGAGEAVFAVARIVGWIAHALEEYAEPGLRFRAEGVYTGPRPPGR
jgi:citrate synthase